MRFLILMMAALVLAGCGSRQVYTDQLAFLQQQTRDRQAALDAREERLAQRTSDCSVHTDAGALSACMLGVTAITLASNGGAAATQPAIVMPAPPPSGWRIAGEFFLGLTKIAAPVVLGLRQSDNATDASIAQGAQLYGFLGRSAEAQSAFGSAALGSMERLGTTAVETVGETASDAVGAMADTSAAWADAAPMLAPDITVTGTGNGVGDGNTLTLDQSQIGRDRIGEGIGNGIEIDQSAVSGNRLHQEGENNRQASPGPYDQDVVCELVTPGAPGAPGTGTGANGGDGGGGLGILTCAPRAG